MTGRLCCCLREPPDPIRLTSWPNGIPNTLTTYIVVQSADVAATAPDAEIRIIEDPDGELADAADLPSPNDGGPGVGYAVVDSRGLVRCSTLDPSWYDNSFEVATIVWAVP
ncbi:MAG: hypothetical protein ACR2JK_08620 [Geodermatophilaceae bacterium]